MEKTNEPFKDRKRIVQDLLEEVEMADQHLERAQNTTCEPTDLRYFLSWCSRHIERAKSLLEKL